MDEKLSSLIESLFNGELDALGKVVAEQFSSHTIHGWKEKNNHQAIALVTSPNGLPFVACYDIITDQRMLRNSETKLYRYRAPRAATLSDLKMLGFELVVQPTRK